jgi:hypothetical protein
MARRLGDETVTRYEVEGAQHGEILDPLLLQRLDEAPPRALEGGL